MSCSVVGLPNGSKVLVNVHATSNIGSGKASANATATPTSTQDCKFFGPYANLQGCVLTGANLKDANLAGADLSKADLKNAIMTGATLAGVASGGITGTPKSLPTDWKLIDGYLIGPRTDLANVVLNTVDLKDVDLSDANLTGSSILGVNLTGANLTGADLSGATIAYTNLTTSNLTNADLKSAALGISVLTHAKLAGANLTGITSRKLSGTPATLPAGWSITGGYLIGSTADLTGDDLTSANLPGADLSTADLSDANLSNANLAMANLSSANLSGANLSGTNLDYANLDPCPPGTPTNLTGATLDSQTEVVHTDFSCAILTNAVLDGVDLSSANLTGVVSGGVTGSGSTFPAGWMLSDGGGNNPDDGYLVGPGADLENANLQGANLTDADLDGANLSFAELADSTLTGVNTTEATILTEVSSGGIIGTPVSLPTNWTLVDGDFNAPDDGYLVGPKANLEGADLSGAANNGGQIFNLNFQGANLENASLESALIQEADFTDANLENASLEGTDLIGDNFSDADLTNAALVGSYISGARLAGATLTGVISSYVVGQQFPSGDIQGPPASLPTNWSWVKLAQSPIEGFLVGPGANLTNAVFTASDLTGADLQGANLQGANLGSSTLTDANLAGATLTGVISAQTVDNSNYGIFGTPTALPTGWTLVSEYTGADPDFTGQFLVGPYANLSGTTLVTSIDAPNLQGIDLAGATLCSSILIPAYPPSEEVNWSSVIGDNPPAVDNFSGANFNNAAFGSSSCGKFGSDLAGDDFTGATFLDTNFYGTLLVGDNLTNADLDGATNLSSEQLLDNTWSNTTCPDGVNSDTYSPQTCVNDLG